MQSRPPTTSARNVSRLSVHLVLAALVIALLALSGGAAAQQRQTFGRLFPELPPYDAPDDATLDALTAAKTASGANGPLFDDGAAAGNNPDGVRAFFTYLGQFLDHDMTLDSLPLPVDFVDPNTIPNDRDQRLNLDSVYGNRNRPNPALYEADGKHLRLDDVKDLKDRDLPRNANGSAIIGDPRNDENQIIAQIHVAFLRAHNKLIEEGFKFEDARRLMEWRHQWIVVHEFLPEVLDPDVYNDVFRANRSHPHITQIHTRYYDPSNAAKAEMPVEFSVGAYRFGHSQVRAAYRLAENLPELPAPFIQVFHPAEPDLRGGRPIAADRVIFWPNFLNVDGLTPAVNISRKIDTLLSSGLFNLPIPGAEASGTAILAKRNIQRAREYGLPSGQAVAKRLGLPALKNSEIAPEGSALAAAGLTDDPLGPYKGEAPLWLYILAEAQIVHNGAKLGPVGSRIVAEVIGGLLAADKNSYIRRGFVPEGGDFRIEDLLREAGVLD
jgi:Animal haem peroxidase